MGNHAYTRNTTRFFNHHKEENRMKRITAIVLAAAVMSFAAAGFAQDDHTVSIAVSAVNEINVSDGAVTLTINAATAGDNLTAVTDNSSSLDWTTNQATRRITVALGAEYASGITLAVQAGAPSGTGTAVGTQAGGYVNLSTTAADLVTAISNAYATSTLTYRATADVTAGVVASESQTVTYTITGS